MWKRLILIFPFLMLVGCASKQSYTEIVAPELTALNIIDRNGLSETISTQERVVQYQCVDFLQPQPYQKVLRIFGRDPQGNISSCINSYHPNGQPKQYLEIVNARAYGRYAEWYANGCMKIDSTVIGGAPDIDDKSTATWLFEGGSKAWAENGCLEAEFWYVKGQLSGLATYYHANGSIWKVIPYQCNQINGTMQVYLDNGQLFQTIGYLQGIKHGATTRYWRADLIASQEIYNQGLLESGFYCDGQGAVIAEIAAGKGLRAVFGKQGVSELQTYNNGVLDGKVELFDEWGGLVEQYFIKNDLKHGEEIQYYGTPFFSNAAACPTKPIPKLSITWYEGKIQGLVKTWYENGCQESQKEISHNCKNGLLSAWYRDGSLMLLEEYDHDKLIKGDYFKRGDKYPLSQVHHGKGTATIFDSYGNFMRKVNYHQGRLAD